MTSDDWWFYYDPSPQYCDGGIFSSKDKGVCQQCKMTWTQHDNSTEQNDRLAYLAAHAAGVEERKRAKRAMQREQMLRKNMDFRPKFSQANQDEAVDAVLNYVTRQAESGGPIFIHD